MAFAGTEPLLSAKDLAAKSLKGFLCSLIKPLVLVTGCLGQLGRAIQQHWFASQMAISYELLPVDIDQLDLTDTDDLIAYLDQLRPAIIINAAAFTDVDAAETNREAVYAVNAEGRAVTGEMVPGQRV